MERKATYPIDYVFEQLGDDIFKTAKRTKRNPLGKIYKVFDGDVIKANSQRYQTFKKCGTKCCVCGLEASFFAKEKHARDKRYHLNLYGIDKDGNEILFTKDHIIPKAKGGTSTLDNYQTMCQKCNSMKSDTLEEDRLVKRVKNNDSVEIDYFGTPRKITVFSTGDSQFKDGKFREDDFVFNKNELDCLNWFLKNVKISDYTKEILDHCNEEYNMWCEKTIKEWDVPYEIDIDSIAVNIRADAVENEPEISFCGNCGCNPEHGICIGFKNKKFLGISTQDWTL